MRYLVSVCVLLLLGFATAEPIETVCVTGAGGYVATELVKQLLDKGYHVRGTVRSLTNPEKFAHLYTLENGAPGSLKLLEADLMTDGSFDACCSGVQYVFHTASPFHFAGKDGQKDLIDPAVVGTKNVMRSAKKGGAKRVILTSSFAAMNSFTPDDKPKDGLYREDDWNEFTDEKVWKKDPMQMYLASKSLAERAAWEATKEHGLELVVINPSLVLGPTLSPRADAVSISTIHTLAKGDPMGMAFPICDVRDVGRAHVLGMTAEEGRYIVSQAYTTPPSQAYQILAKAFPQLSFKKPETEESPALIIDNSKIVKLLGGLIPIEETVTDMVRAVLSLGHVQNQASAKSEL